jgi:hypothetical protein
MQLIGKERWKAHQSVSVVERHSQSKRWRYLQDTLQAARETALALDDACVKGCDLVPGAIASNYMICIGFVSLSSFLIKNNLESVSMFFPNLSQSTGLQTPIRLISIRAFYIVYSKMCSIEIDVESEKNTS